MLTAHQHLKLARIVAQLLDSQFNFFGIHFGIDALVGFIPGVGDFLGFIFSLYLLFVGMTLKLPADKLLQMLINIMIDGFIGSIPIVGDLVDIFYRANIKNLEILEAHFPRDVNHKIVDAEIVE